LIKKPTILTLNYFRCAGICAPILNSVADVINQVQLEPGKDFQVITVSFDPSDTPEIAEQKQISYLNLMRRPIDPAAWRFLTGDAVNTKQVADSVGFFFRPDKDQFVHPGVIMVLTPEGIVSQYIYGSFYLPAEVQMAIQKAEAGEVTPTISRFLAFCYNYDPESRRYVLSATRVAGIAVLVFAAGFILFLYAGRSRGKKEPKRSTE
jgi:protein SCO1/2